MATIIRKVKKGKTYFYAVQSGRVNGKPRIIWQKYLGTIDNIIKQKDSSDHPHVNEVDIFQAGAIAAFVGIAKRIHIVNIIDKIVPKRSQGPSIGEYILVAILNRIVSPCSKKAMPEWYQSTVLRRLWKYDPSDFDSQAFWNHMDLIPEDAIEKIQYQITRAVINEFKIDPSGLLYDSTNFFTFIATGNNRNTLAQRGRNKQKRDDLRQVGLALLVTKDFHIPLFHRTYRGNQPDQGLFSEIAMEICETTHKAFKRATDTTLVFDKGNISEKAMETLVASGKHLVAAIPKDILPNLFETDIEKLLPVQGLSGTKTINWEVVIWNITFKVVLAHTESFVVSDMADIMEKVRKAENQLKNLNTDIQKWKTKNADHGKRPTVTSVRKRAKELIASKYVEKLIQIDVKEYEGLPFIEYNIDLNKINRLFKNELGRTMIISTRRDWSDAEIISAYRGLNTIETAFKHMKNRDYLHWQPAFHWTDQKIKMHSLYCVLALLLTSLAHKCVAENGIALPLPKLIEELEDIREVALIYNEENSDDQKNRLVLSKMSPRQKRLAEILEIGKILKG